MIQTRRATCLARTGRSRRPRPRRSTDCGSGCRRGSVARTIRSSCRPRRPGAARRHEPVPSPARYARTRKEVATMSSASEWMTLFDGTSLDGWHGRDSRGAAKEHTWRVAADVRLRPDNDRLFAVEPGTGVMVNGDDGRTADLSTDAEHGSCEL